LLIVGLIVVLINPNIRRPINQLMSQPVLTKSTLIYLNIEYNTYILLKTIQQHHNIISLQMTPIKVNQSQSSSLLVYLWHLLQLSLIPYIIILFYNHSILIRYP
jgi:hypothetical protein